MTVYHYNTNSFAAIFFSDPGAGFVRAPTPMDALKKVVANYKHPCDLYAATITTCEPKPKTLARFLSQTALAQQKAAELSRGGIRREGDKFRILNERSEEVYLSIKELAPDGDLYELVSSVQKEGKGQ